MANCSETSVRKIKKEVGLKTYKVEKVPERNSKKNIEAKKRAKVLQRNFIRNFECCVMDDETYVLADFLQLPGQEFYVTNARWNVPEDCRVKNNQNFQTSFFSGKPFVLVVKEAVHS